MNSDWKRAAALLVVAAAAWTTLQAAAQESAEEVLEKMRKKYDSITDAELRFTQKVKFPLAKVEQSVAGTLLVKKQNRYRVETPEQTIVTDGQTVWSYSPSTRQLLIDTFKQDERSLTPEKLLTGASGDFQPVLVGREKLGRNDVVQIKLTPRDDEGLVSSVRFWVDEDEWMVRQVEIVDANGRKTTYTVQQSRVNPGLPDSRFTFQAPEGAEVVDLR